MQTVTDAWKEAHSGSLVPISYIEISYRAGDPDAQENAVAAVTTGGETDYSDVTDTTGLAGSPPNWSMLEHNMWALDGKAAIIPNSLASSALGFVSSVLSGADTVFATKPLITITFPALITQASEGMTIEWSSAYSEMATDFIITAYNGATQVVQAVVTGNTDVTSEVEIALDEYDRITVQIEKWCLPARRARIAEIMVGVEKIYQKSDIMGHSHEMSVDLLSAALPVNKAVFQISNVDSEWNPENPQGSAQYLAKRQRMTIKYGYLISGAVEWIDAGTFWLSEWDTPSNGQTASFTARGLTEFMSDKYSGITTGSLLQIAIAALTQADLPLQDDGSVRYHIDATATTALVSISVDDAGLADLTIAEVLQMCANAACCVMYEDRLGVLHIKQLSATLTDYVIDQFHSYSNPEISLLKELKSVKVNEFTEITSTNTSGEVQTVSNPLIQSQAVANDVGAWVRDILLNRKQLTGDYRPDPRLDPLDEVSQVNKFASNTMIITSIKYDYNGAFRGRYTGRVIV